MVQTECGTPVIFTVMASSVKQLSVDLFSLSCAESPVEFGPYPKLYTYEAVNGMYSTSAVLRIG